MKWAFLLYEGAQQAASTHGLFNVFTHSNRESDLSAHRRIMMGTGPAAEAQKERGRNSSAAPYVKKEKATMNELNCQLVYRG